MGCGGSTSRVVSPELNAPQPQTDTSEDNTGNQELSLEEKAADKTTSVEVEVCIEANTNNNNNNSGAEVAAATRIQATYRGYATRKAIKADSDNVFTGDNTSASTAPEEQANVDTTVPSEQANADTTVPSEQANADTTTPSEQANADTTTPSEQANADTTAPEEVSKSAAESPEDEDNNSPPIVITSAPPDENTPPLQSALVKHNTPTKTGRKVTIDDEAQFLGDSSEVPPSRDQETNSEAVPTEETIVTEEANDATKDTEQTKDNAEPVEGENASQSTDTVAQGADCETKTNENDSAVESQEKSSS